MLSGGHAIVATSALARAVSAAGGDQLTQTGLAIGTPAYLRPSKPRGRASGSPQRHLQSRVRALRTLAVSRRLPARRRRRSWARHSRRGVRLKIVRDAIPDELEVVIERALEKVPAIANQTSGSSPRRSRAAEHGCRVRASPRRRGSRAAAHGAPPHERRHRRRCDRASSAGAWLLFGRHARMVEGTGSLVQNRVAVLYFTDESRDSSLRYLADGFTETLIDQLSTIHALDVVIARRRRPVPGDATCRVTRSRARSRPVHSSRAPWSRSDPGRASHPPGGRREQRGRAASEFRVTDRRTLALRDSLVSRAAVFLRNGSAMKSGCGRTGQHKERRGVTLVQQARSRRRMRARAALNDPRSCGLYAHRDSLLESRNRRIGPGWNRS